MKTMKRQDILRMYKDDAITTEEALDLLFKTKDEQPAEEEKPKEVPYADLKAGIIEDIIESTDFNGIKKAMDERDWSYSNKPVTIKELTDLATNLLDEALDNVLSKIDDADEEPYWRVSTGGFQVEAWYDDESDSVEASLSFVLCETGSGKELGSAIDLSE